MSKDEEICKAGHLVLFVNLAEQFWMDISKGEKKPKKNKFIT